MMECYHTKRNIRNLLKKQMFSLNISCTFEIIKVEKNTSPKTRKGKFWELTKTE